LSFFALPVEARLMWETNLVGLELMVLASHSVTSLPFREIAETACPTLVAGRKAQ
jgi:hypothetical protein